MENDMATKADDESTANKASGFSGFGGHLLASPEDEGVAIELGSDGPALVSALMSLGIEDAEQVVAVVAISQVRSELQRVLGLKDKSFKDFLDKVQHMLPEASAAALSSPSPKDLGLGVRAPTVEMMAAVEASAAEVEPLDAVELPGSVNLIPFFSRSATRDRAQCVNLAACLDPNDACLSSD
jgi:hypothetical protein